VTCHVDEDAASDDRAACPLVDAELGAWAAVDLLVGDAVVVAVLAVADVRQAVPLATCLQPEPIDVVVAVDQPGRGVVGAAGLDAARLVADVEDVVGRRRPPTRDAVVVRAAAG
jgi:adenosine/AMP kinase